MTENEILDQLYNQDGIRNVNFLQNILSDDFTLEWDSSIGNSKFTKSEILNFAKELKLSYHSSKTSILNKVIENNKAVVHYLHHVSTIENPKELFTIAKVIVIWEFKNDKIIKGYQISKS